MVYKKTGGRCSTLKPPSPNPELQERLAALPAKATIADKWQVIAEWRSEAPIREIEKLNDAPSGRVGIWT